MLNVCSFCAIKSILWFSLLEPVPEHCPGTDSSEAGKASACEGCPNQKICASAQPAPPDPSIEVINDRFADVKHKILVSIFDYQKL